MKIHPFWWIQDSHNERARVGFWLETKRWRFHFTITWHKPCEFRDINEGASCFVFRKLKPLFKYSLSLMCWNLQLQLHYDEVPEHWPPGPTGEVGMTGDTGHAAV